MEILMKRHENIFDFCSIYHRLTCHWSPPSKSFWFRRSAFYLYSICAAGHQTVDIWFAAVVRWIHNSKSTRLGHKGKLSKFHRNGQATDGQQNPSRNFTNVVESMNSLPTLKCVFRISTLISLFDSVPCRTIAILCIHYQFLYLRKFD